MILEDSNNNWITVKQSVEDFLFMAGLGYFG